MFSLVGNYARFLNPDLMGHWFEQKRQRWLETNFFFSKSGINYEKR